MSFADVFKTPQIHTLFVNALKIPPNTQAICRFFESHKYTRINKTLKTPSNIYSI